VNSRFKPVIVLAVIVVIIAALVWWLRPEQEQRYELQGDESPLLRFVIQHLLDPSGGIYTNLRDDLELAPDMAGNHQMLSESTGLMMAYALRTDRKELYETQVSFLTRYLMTGDGQIRWVYEKRGPYSDVHANASIDDLKIIGALFAAAERWRIDRYERLADRLAQVLLDHGVTEDGYLADYYDWRYGGMADTITSSYLELEVLGKLADRDPSWQPIHERAADLLRSAHLPNGLFYKTYVIPERRWIVPEEFNMIDVLYAALHLMQGGGDATNTVSLIERKWLEDGQLFASYDGQLKPVNRSISPAVYALAYRLMVRADRPDVAEELGETLHQLSIRDDQSPYYGGFVEPSTREAYSFDHLQALLAESETEAER
jgi:hypothetical protein